MRPAQITNFIPFTPADQNKELVRAVLGGELAVTSHQGFFSPLRAPLGGTLPPRERVLKTRCGGLP